MGIRMGEFLLDVLTTIHIKRTSSEAIFLLTNLLYEEKEDEI